MSEEFELQHSDDDRSSRFFPGEAGFVRAHMEQDEAGHLWLCLSQMGKSNESPGVVRVREDELARFLCFARQFENRANALPEKQHEPVAPLSHMDTMKAKHQRAYQPWDAEEEEELRLKWRETHNMRELGQHFGRNPGAVASRLRKLGLIQ